LDGLPAEEHPGLGLARAAVHRRLLDHRARGLESGQPADPGHREQGAYGDEDDPDPESDPAQGDDVEATLPMLTALGTAQSEPFGDLPRQLVRRETS
jgi:hypothetical protein